MKSRFTVVKMRRELLSLPFDGDNYKIFDEKTQKFGLATYNNLRDANFYADKKNMKEAEVWQKP